MNKLLSNYKRANIISRLAFILAYAVATIPSCQISASMLMPNPPVSLIITTALLSGLIMSFILPMVVKIVVIYSRLLTLPLSECKVIVLLSVAVGQCAVIACNALGLLLPVTGVYLFYLGKLLSVAVSMLLIYKWVGSNYINDLIKPYFFKVICICFLIFMVMGVVL